MSSFKATLSALGFGSVKIGDAEVANITRGVQFFADAGESVKVNVELQPEAPIELELDARVTVVIKAVDGEIIKTPLEDGKMSYKVIRQAPMFPPGT